MSLTHKMCLIFALAFFVLPPDLAQAQRSHPSSTQYQREQYKTQVKQHVRRIVETSEEAVAAQASQPSPTAAQPNHPPARPMPLMPKPTEKPAPTFQPSYPQLQAMDSPASNHYGYAPVVNPPVYIPHRVTADDVSSSSGYSTYTRAKPSETPAIPHSLKPDTTPETKQNNATRNIVPSAGTPPPAITYEKYNTSSNNDASKLSTIDTDQPALVPTMEKTSPEQFEQMSQETQEILAALPKDITGQDYPIQKRNIGIDRIDPNVSIPEAPVTSHESLGMKVAVKKLKADINYELEKAYDALIAGETETAVKTYKNVLEIDRNNTLALFGLATTYHRIGLLDQARPIYGHLLSIDPYNKEALNNFLALVGEEAPQKALEQLARLEAANPEFSPIPAQMALIYKRLGDYPNAINHMQRAASLSPENLAYKYNLAILMDQGGQAREAIILYKQILKMHYRGEVIPANANDIQERLTFLASNRQ